MSYFDNFDFNRAYPNGGDLEGHVALAIKKDANRSDSSYGTMFNAWEVKAHRKLFELAKDDPEVQAALAKLICWGDDRARFTQFGR